MQPTMSPALGFPNIVRVQPALGGMEPMVLNKATPLAVGLGWARESTDTAARTTFRRFPRFNTSITVNPSFLPSFTTACTFRRSANNGASYVQLMFVGYSVSELDNWSIGFQSNAINFNEYLCIARENNYTTGGFTAPLGLNTNHTMAISYDGTNARFYANGALVTTVARALPTAANFPRCFVSFKGTTANETITNQALWYRALSATEIANYFANPSQLFKG